MSENKIADVLWEEDRTEADLIADLRKGQVGCVASDTGSFVQKLNDETIRIIQPGHDAIVTYVTDWPEFKAALQANPQVIVATTDIQVPHQALPTPEAQFYVDQSDKLFIGNLVFDRTGEATAGKYYFGSNTTARSVRHYGALKLVGDIATFGAPTVMELEDAGVGQLDWYTEELRCTEANPEGNAHLHVNRSTSDGSATHTADTILDWEDPWLSADVESHRYGVIPSNSGGVARTNKKLQTQLDMGAYVFRVPEYGVEISGTFNCGGYDYSFESAGIPDIANSAHTKYLSLTNTTWVNTRATAHYPGSMTFACPVQVTGTFNASASTWSQQKPKFLGEFNCSGVVTVDCGALYVANLTGSEISIAAGTTVYYESKDSTTVISGSGSAVKVDWYRQSGKGFVVKTETNDFTAENNTIHLVATSTVDITATIPDAVDRGFQTRMYKTTGIDLPDVTVTTYGGVQLIGGLTTQSIFGESEGFYVVSHNDHYDIIQDNRGKIQRKLSESTTIISGYGVSRNAGDSNTIDIGAGIYSREVCGATPTPPATSDLTSPTSETIKTDAITGLAVTGIATDGYTIFQITDTGTITQTLNDVPTISSQSVSPRIAVVIHFGGNVVGVEPWWTVGQNPSQRVSWLLNKFGILKEGVSIFGATAGNLQIANDSGVISYDGADGDKSPTNPDEQAVSSNDPVAHFILAKQDGSVNFAQTVIDPTQIDVGGTLTTLAGNDKVSIQRLYINRNGTFSVQYGQNPYATMSDAITALVERQDAFVQWNVLDKVARIGTYLIIDRACTDLTDTTQATFLQTGLLETGAGADAVTQLIDLKKALENGSDGGGLPITNISDLLVGASPTSGNRVVIDPTGAKPFHLVGGSNRRVLEVLTTTGLGNFQVYTSGSGIFEAGLRDVAGDQVVKIHSDGGSYFNGGYVGFGTDDPEYAVHVEGVGESGIIAVSRSDRVGSSKLEQNTAGGVLSLREDDGTDGAAIRSYGESYFNGGIITNDVTISDIDAGSSKTLTTKEYVQGAPITSGSAISLADGEALDIVLWTSDATTLEVRDDANTADKVTIGKGGAVPTLIPVKLWIYRDGSSVHIEATAKGTVRSYGGITASGNIDIYDTGLIKGRIRRW